LGNYFKKYERIGFLIFLVLTFSISALGLYCVFNNWSNGAKLLGTAGLLATVTGVIQLEVSGFFEKIFEHYDNEKKYPYGPPSYVTREVIDNPDRPISTWFRNTCFFNARTGFWLIVIGTLIQIAATWV
jgi:hypothetical protein